MKKLKKRTTERIKTVAIVALTVSAVFLMLRLPVMRSGFTGRFKQIVMPNDTQDSSHTLELDAVVTPYHLIITNDGTYGRYGQICADADDPLLRQLLPLFREALGSSEKMIAVADQTMREALAGPNLYMDLRTPLPQTVVAAWLGETSHEERNIRGLVLAEDEQSASLYLLCDEGVYRGRTALSAVAVTDQTRSTVPNGYHFAYETGYGSLMPYTVLSGETRRLARLAAEVPAGYTAFNLLSALDFNPHTIFRYTENSGVEVVEDSPRTLRIGPDGTVAYTGGDEPSGALYRVPSGGDRPRSLDAIEAAVGIAAALTESTGGSAVHLQSVEPTEKGYCIRFTYEMSGFPVCFGSGDSALEVQTGENAVVSFSYRCRSYSISGESVELMPPDMAAAIAALRPGSGLAVGYVDSGGETIDAQWLAE